MGYCHFDSPLKFVKGDKDGRTGLYATDEGRHRNGYALSFELKQDIYCPGEKHLKRV